jgi:hypothetical protein
MDSWKPIDTDGVTDAAKITFCLTLECHSCGELAESEEHDGEDADSFYIGHKCEELAHDSACDWQVFKGKAYCADCAKKQKVVAPQPLPQPEDDHVDQDTTIGEFRYQTIYFGNDWYYVLVRLINSPEGRGAATGFYEADDHHQAEHKAKQCQSKTMGH